jgi:fucose permease
MDHNQQSETVPVVLPLKKIGVHSGNRYSLMLTGYLYLLTIMSAVSMTMIGPIMPRIIAEHNLELSQGGLVMTFQSIGGVGAIVLGGIIADFVKKSRLILTSFFTLGLALFLLVYVKSFAVILVVFFVFGAASRMFDSISNAYISDIHLSRKALFLNLLHTIFGIGAFAGPIYAGYLLERGISWNSVFSFVGITCIVIILLMPLLIRKGKNAGTAINGSTSSSGNPLKHVSAFGNSSLIWLLCLIMLLYMGHQSILITWAPMYMETKLAASTTFSGLALSSLWLGIILGRIICAWLTYRVPVIKLLMAGSLLAGIVLGFGLFSGSIVLLIVSMGLAGIFSGAVIPLIVTIACDRYPGHTGSATSLIFLSGAFATMIFPWLTGKIADKISFGLAMNLSWITLLIILVMGVGLNKSLKTKQHAGSVT